MSSAPRSERIHPCAAVFTQAAAYSRYRFAGVQLASYRCLLLQSAFGTELARAESQRLT